MTTSTQAATSPSAPVVQPDTLAGFCSSFRAFISRTTAGVVDAVNSFKDGATIRLDYYGSEQDDVNPLYRRTTREVLKTDKLDHQIMPMVDDAISKSSLGDVFATINGKVDGLVQRIEVLSSRFSAWRLPQSQLIATDDTIDTSPSAQSKAFSDHLEAIAVPAEQATHKLATQSRWIEDGKLHEHRAEIPVNLDTTSILGHCRSFLKSFTSPARMDIKLTEYNHSSAAAATITEGGILTRASIMTQKWAESFSSFLEGVKPQAVVDTTAITATAIKLGEKFLRTYAYGEMMDLPWNQQVFAPGQLNHLRTRFADDKVVEEGQKIYGGEFGKHADLADIKAGNLLNMTDGRILLVTKVLRGSGGYYKFFYDQVQGSKVTKGLTLDVQDGTLQAEQFSQGVFCRREYSEPKKK